MGNRGDEKGNHRREAGQGAVVKEEILRTRHGKEGGGENVEV